MAMNQQKLMKQMQKMQEDMARAQEQLALRTIQTWGDWRTGQQKVQALRESLQTHQRLYALIKRRVQKWAAFTPAFEAAAQLLSVS